MLNAQPVSKLHSRPKFTRSQPFHNISSYVQSETRHCGTVVIESRVTAYFGWISLGVILPQNVEVVSECEVDPVEESRLVVGRLRILNSIWRTWVST